MREVSIPAGQRVQVYSKNFSSIAGTVTFEAASATGSDAPQGTVEVCGSNWVFKKPPISQPLAASNRADKGFWDTFYSIYVTPEQDIVVRISGGGKSSFITLLAIVVIVVVLACGAMWFATAQ